LIELVSRKEFGQVFITDTSKEKIQKLFKGIDAEIKIFKVKDGMITE
jgi:DNA replication and repair protein RecF